MIKLLYITNGLSGVGGLERVLSIKASYLADKYEYEVHIVTLNEEGKKPFYSISSKVIIHSITASGGIIRYIYQYLVSLRNIIKVIKPDIISVCDDGLKGFTLPYLLRKPCPMLYERHVSKLNSIIEQKRNILKKMLVLVKFTLMNALARSFNNFVVLTEGNKQEWKLSNIIVIPNPTSFYPDEFSSLTNKKVIAVGKQSFQKGYDLLLQVWQLVIQKYPDWVLAIYGKYNPELNLEDSVANLKISGSVLFYPPEKEIKNKYIESSIYVMTSRYEGFGMVLIEAMACGVPCVSFDCPHGPADIIRHGEDGFLVKGGDIVGMAEKIVLLIENDLLRQKMGICSRENVKRYLPDNIIPLWDSLFKELTKN